jgi:hypothetical protein
MTDKTILELPVADPLDGDEVLHLVQAGNSRQATASDVAGAPHVHALATALAAGFMAAADKVKLDGLEAYVAAQIAALIDAAPGTLDTLGEIAAALQADEGALAALTTTVSGKLDKAANLSDLLDVGVARANLGIEKRILAPSITGIALASDEILAAFTPPSGESWTFPANFSGASGLKLAGGVNPASSYVIDFKKNGAVVGTITISTGGVVSFATSGGAAVSLIGGTDEGQIVGPAVAGTAVGYAFAIPFTY